MYDFTPGQIRILRNAIQSIPDSVLCVPLKEELIEDIPEIWQFYVHRTVNNKPMLIENEAQVIVKVMMLELALFSIQVACGNGTDSLVFSSLLCSIANSIAAIEQLATTGFDFQAYALMRTLIEQYMVLITLTLCPEKRKEYCKSEEDDVARQFWHENFTVKRFIRLLTAYKPDPNGMIDKHIKDVYSRLSLFAHNSFWRNFSRTYIQTEDGSGVKLNQFGEYVSRTEQILEDMVYDIWPFHLLFFTMLRDEKIDMSYESFANEKNSPFFMSLLKRCHLVERVLASRLFTEQRKHAE